jgi:translation initiation factor IF-1
MANNKEVIELAGVIIETLPGTQFVVELENASCPGVSIKVI